MEVLALKKQIQTEKTNWLALTQELGKNFEKRAAHYDQTGAFVVENYEQLKAHRFFSAMIPEELGGGGISHAEMCDIIRTIAHYCSSTALAFSMHQHLVAATVWKYKKKGEGAALLKRVAEEQLVLISTGEPVRCLKLRMITSPMVAVVACRRSRAQPTCATKFSA